MKSLRPFGGSELRTPGVLAWLRLARIFQKIDRATAEHLRTWDISVAQFDVLAQVGAAEGLMQQELADHLLVTKGNISQLLERLERRGLIRRSPDGRAMRLALTEEGRRLVDEVVPRQEHLIAERLSVLCADDQVALLRLLRKLDRAQP